MRIVYEIQNTATSLYPQEKQKRAKYKDHEYILLGRSTEKHAGLGWRLARMAEVIGKLCVAILLFPLALEGFRDSLKNSWEELATGQEIIQHYVLTTTVQRALMRATANQLKALIGEMGNVHVRSAKYLAHIDFDKGQIHKEFIISKSDGTALTPDDLRRQMDKIEGTLASELKESFGPYKEMHLFMMMKEMQAGPFFYKAYADDVNGRARLAGQGKCHAHDLYDIFKKYALQCGFPLEIQWKGDAFVPGKHYQKLESVA